MLLWETKRTESCILWSCGHSVVFFSFLPKWNVWSKNQSIMFKNSERWPLKIYERIKTIEKSKGDKRPKKTWRPRPLQWPSRKRLVKPRMIWKLCKSLATYEKLMQLDVNYNLNILIFGFLDFLHRFFDHKVILIT